MSHFKAKMHQIRFPLGLHPRPRWGSLQGSPRPHIAVFKGPTCKGREGKREGREGSENKMEWEKGMGSGGKGRGQEGRSEVRGGEGICRTNVKLLPTCLPSRRQPIAVIGGRCRSRAENLQRGTVEAGRVTPCTQERLT